MSAKIFISFSVEAIQVCYELNDQNQKRETEGLKKIDKFIKADAKTIITYNQEETIEDINIVPFWKFFSKF